MKDKKLNKENSAREQKEKEQRRWRWWEFIGAFLSVFSFRPWRDLTMRREVMPHLDPKSPMEGLAGIAETGYVAPQRLKVKHFAMYKHLDDLMKIVAEKDGVVAEKELEFSEELLIDYAPNNFNDAQRQEIIDYLHKPLDPEFHLRNTCVILKENLKDRFLPQLIEDLYKLAYLDGLEMNERHLVDKIGDLLELPAVEIRRAAFKIRKELESESNQE